MRQRDAVDWDLLADHLGGALAGTPEGTEIARLVATDPSWSQAAAELSAGLDAVATDLRALPPPPALPDDVAARLDTALRAVNPVAGGELPGHGPAGAALPAADPTADGAEPAPVPDQRAGAPGSRSGAGHRRSRGGSRRPRGRAAGAGGRADHGGAAGASGRADHGPGGPAAEPRRPAGPPSRRRIARWGAGLVLAVGLLGFGAVGISSWLSDDPATVAGGGDDSEDPDVAAPAQAPSAGEPLVEGAAKPAIVASGTDYQPPTVGTGEPAVPTNQDSRTGTPEIGPADTGAPMAQPPQSTTGTERVPDVVPPTLAWMWVDPAARQQCLDLIRAELGPPPVTIDTVDFAQFEGQDAIVLWATVAGDTRVVWVSGAQCGTPGAGPDGIFQDQLS